MDPENLDDPITGIASLAEPQRRRLYQYVVSRRQPVSKDEAAEALDLARSVVTFHLDRLVADGMLVADYRRLTGRSGPGAGRPAKLYRRPDRDVAVSLPVRTYRLAADLMARAVTSSVASGEPVDRALDRVAQDHGHTLGGQARDRAIATSRAALLTAAAAVLEDQGYEPVSAADSGEIVLANCPFHALVEDHRDLVCRLNHAVLGGMCATMPEAGMSAHLEPSPDVCCVRLRPDTPGSSAS